jgi:polar amino acid transport system substrate-binding protein
MTRTLSFYSLAVGRERVPMHSTKSNPYLRAFATALGLAAWLFAIDPLHAQSDEARRLAPKGELRAALIVSNSVLVTRSPEGQLGGVLVDIANALATKLSVPLHLVPCNNVVLYNRSIGKDEWDVALTPRDLSRVELLGFSEPFLVVDNGYVVRAGSSLMSADDVDRAGIRVAVIEHSPADGFLTRTLKKATIVRLLPGIEEAREALAFGRADVYADNVQLTSLIATQLGGARTLVGHFSSVNMTFAVPKSNAAVLPTLNKFIDDAKHDGVIADAIKHASLFGVRPPMR